MKKYLIFSLLALNLSMLLAQEEPVLKLTSGQVEALFLKQNLQLMAEQMNIDMADAAILQAKLWDNPTLSVGDISVWNPKKEQQFSIEISQIILTANKRRKLINLEKSAKEVTLAEFEGVLLTLKKELRQTLYELTYLQSYQKILKKEEQSVSQLLEAYQKQFVGGNISKPELLRLQSSLLELMSEQNETAVAIHALQTQLKSFLNIDNEIVIEDNALPDFKAPEALSLSTLWQMAAENRPDLKHERMQAQYGEKALIYEKSLAFPDVTLSANYDRYGGVWKNFIGVGLSIDLPFVNRNQGNVKAARIAIQQNQYLLQQQENIARNEVTEAFRNYAQAYQFYQRTSKNGLSEELDTMLDLFSRKLLNKDISLLEYIDFMSAYKNNKQILFSAEKQLHATFETLQFAVGKEIL